MYQRFEHYQRPNGTNVIKLTISEERDIIRTEVALEVYYEEMALNLLNNECILPL